MKEIVEKLRKYGIKTTEEELLEKEKQRLIKSLKDYYESGHIDLVNTTLKKLEKQ